MAQPCTRYAAVGRCIYCGSTELPLGDEHIIPLALNGVLVLPRASCSACADITKRFEQTVARAMYGNFRVKQGFRTRRKKDRPKILPLYTIALDGTQKRIDTLIQDYPTVFLAVDAPPPGILKGLEPTDRSPELKISLKANPKELSKTMDAISHERILTEHVFEWGAFFRQLAKVGHCYAFACTRGREYQPLLRDIILGRSSHLSHYVGGTEANSTVETDKSELSLSIVCKPTGDFLVAGVQLLGVGTLHPYQVVVGRIPSIEAFVTATIEARSTA